MKQKEKPAAAQGVVAGKSLQPEDGAKISNISVDNTQAAGNNTHADDRTPDWYSIEVSEFNGVKSKQAEFDCSLEEVVKIAQGDRDALLFFGNVGKKLEYYRKFNQSAIIFRRTLQKIRDKNRRVQQGGLDVQRRQSLQG